MLISESLVIITDVISDSTKSSYVSHISVNNRVTVINITGVSVWCIVYGPSIQSPAEHTPPVDQVENQE